ncbi:hypothetical protein V8C37DRAFT_381509 [Trichoderma ceciliae]
MEEMPGKSGPYFSLSCKGKVEPKGFQTPMKKGQDESDSLKATVDTLREEVGRLSGEMAHLKNEQDLFQDTCERLKRENQRRMWEISKLQQDNSEVRERCERLEQKNDELQKGSNKLRATVGNLQANINENKELFNRFHMLYDVFKEGFEKEKQFHNHLRTRLDTAMQCLEILCSRMNSI